MIKRFFSFKRLLLLLLIFCIGGVWYVSQNLNPLSVKLLNRILSPYDIKVLNLDTQIASINQLKIPRLILQIEDSYLAIQGFELHLTDALAIASKQQLDVGDILKLSSQQLYIDLGESFFTRQSNDSAESSAAFDLVFNQIPDVDLGEIIVRLPRIDPNQDTSSFRHTLKMDKFTLNPQGDLSTLWQFDDKKLFEMQANISPSKISLNTQLDLAQSFSGLNALSTYLTSALSRNVSHDDELSGSAIVETQKQLAAVLAPLNEHEISIQGQWHTQTTINPLTKAMTSRNHFTQLAIKPERYPNLLFTAKEDFFIDVVVDEQLIPQAFKQETVTAYGAKVSISPIQQQIDFNQAQLSTLLTKLLPAKKAEKYSQFVELISLANPQNSPMSQHSQTESPKVSEDNKAAVLFDSISSMSTDKNASVIQAEFSLSDTTQLFIPLDNPELPISVNTNKIQGKLNGTVIENHLSFTGLYANSFGEIVVDPVTEFSVPSSMNITALLEALDVDALFSEMKLGKTSIGLFSRYERVLNPKYAAAKQADDQTHITPFTSVITLKPSSQLSFGDIHTKLINPQSEGLILSEQVATKDIVIGLATPSVIKLENNQAIFTLPALDLNIKQLQVEQQNALKKQLEFYTDKLKLSWQTDHEFKLSRASKQPWQAQLLAQVSEHKLAVKFNNIRLNQARNKQRMQKVLDLDKITLNQTLFVEQGIVLSEDQWQLDHLTATSRHFIQPNAQSIAGQWLFESSFEKLMPTIKKHQPLPEGLMLDGMLKLAANFAYSEHDNTQLFDLQIAPEMSQLHFELGELYFLDTQISTQCNFHWVREIATNTASSLIKCPKTNMSIEKGQAGVLFNQLNVHANIELTKDPKRPQTNWLQKLTGLSETDIKLSARGNLLDGSIYIPEFVLKLHEKSQGYMLLQGLSLSKFMAQQQQLGVYADGIFDGVLPAELNNGKLSIAGGYLAARKPGGLIQVEDSEAIERLKQTQPYLELVFDALKHLDYQELGGTFDMQDSGDAQIFIGVKGKSKDIVRPVHLNYSHEENLIQLYRSTQIGNQLQSMIEKSVN